MNNQLKYIGYSVVFQEVPDEVSLAINISGCPYHCEGCHSEYLWEYSGNYITDDIPDIIEKYKDLITCVCFMGGDQNPTELSQLLQFVQSHNLKTALYTGCDLIESIDSDVLNNLNYLKIGHYNYKLGGLDNKNTNQRMYIVNKNGEKFKDITNKFWS